MDAQFAVAKDLDSVSECMYHGHQVQKMFQAMDTDHSGSISNSDFEDVNEYIEDHNYNLAGF